MKLRVRKRIEQQNIEQDLYFSGEQENQKLAKQQPSLVANARKNKIQQTKTETVKKEHQGSAKKPSNRKPPQINNSMQIKLQPSDIRFIQKIVEEKHGKILTREQMLSLKKKMVKQTFNQSNPYTQLNYNTGERNQWRDCKKKTLSEDDLRKLKKHFLHIIRMVDKGLEGKYTLRDLSREFNLDEPAFLQMKRQFSIDPDVSIYLQRFSLQSQLSKQNLQIQHFVKKRYILQKVLQKNPLLTKSELSEKISRFLKNKGFFPEHQISRLLQQQGFVWRPIVRLPQSRNFKQNLQRRKVFCEKINYILTQTKYQVFFLGVMNYNSFMFRTEGWTKDEYLIEPIIDESFTLVALTERSGEGTWKFQKQAYKEDVFGEICKTLFTNLVSESFEPKYLAVDIRLSKYSSVLKRARKRFDVEIIWIPPFSIFLNPLQFWFEDIRNSLGKSKRILQLSEQSNISDHKNQVLIKDIYNDLREIFTQKYNANFDFVNFFEMAAKYHQKALEMNKF